MPIAPRMNNPVGPYDFWRDTLQPGLFGLYDRWTEQKPWPTPEQINAAVQNPGLLDLDAMAGYAVDMVQPFAAKLGGLLGHIPVPEGGLFGITTWHGSPHKWTKPDISKVGTGEGAQAYGHGFYSAEARDVAKEYQMALSGVELPNGEIINPDWYDPRFLPLKLLHENNWDYESARKVLTSHGTHDIGPEIAALDELQNLGVNKSAGHLYKLDIPDEDVARYLDWDKPLSEQPEAVRAALFSDESIKKAIKAKQAQINMLRSKNINDDFGVSGLNPDLHGETLYTVIGGAKGVDSFGFPPKGMTSEMNAAKQLSELGIPGIRYLDGSSRSAGEGTYNYVTFDPSRITVLERNGEDLRGLLGMPTVKDISKSWESRGIKNFMSERGDVITLNKIVVPDGARGQGIGQQAMQELIDYADATGKRIGLSPSSDFGGSKSKLEAWYKRLGFERNRSDFDVSESYVRQPKKVGR